MDKIRFLLSSVWDFLFPFIKVMITDAGNTLATAAYESVTIVAATCTDKTGPEKREIAFKRVAATLTTAGIVVSKAFINAAIEAAVIKINDKK